jgi:hypothetical protein
MPLNVFSSLAAYATGENALTEALVFVLRFLLESEPRTGLSIVSRLCGLGSLERCDPTTVDISTQVTVEEGRPDIEIRVRDSVRVYAEVKQDAPLGRNQLEYYLAQLHRSVVAETQLVLLSRSRMAALQTSLDQNDYHHVCWYQVFEWLRACTLEDPVGSYLVESLLGLLEEKKMSTEEVTWEYINGVPALVALTDMLEVAIGEVMPDARPNRTAGWGWRGFRLWGEYWTGIRYAEPLLVVFENDRANPPFTYRLDLDLAQVHFFSLSRGEQLERLVEFLQQAQAGAAESVQGGE